MKDDIVPSICWASWSLRCGRHSKNAFGTLHVSALCALGIDSGLRWWPLGLPCFYMDMPPVFRMAKLRWGGSTTIGDALPPIPLVASERMEKCSRSIITQFPATAPAGSLTLCSGLPSMQKHNSRVEYLQQNRTGDVPRLWWKSIFFHTILLSTQTLSMLLYKLLIRKSTSLTCLRGEACPSTQKDFCTGALDYWGSGPNL
jgi:hypothetical protein